MCVALESTIINGKWIFFSSTGIQQILLLFIMNFITFFRVFITFKMKRTNIISEFLLYCLFLIFFLELFNIQCDSFNSFYQLNYNGVVERTLYWWLYPLESNKLLYFLIEWIIYHFLPRWPFQRNLIWSDLSRFLCSKSTCDFFITINNGIVGKLQFLVYCHFLLFVM